MHAHPTMLMGVYDETLGMLIEARNYMAYTSPRHAHRQPWQTHWFFLHESLRVTSRLTQVMAWLLLQRAIADGEIPATEACLDRNRLSGHNACLNNDGLRDECLPIGLRNLLSRSRHLYLRVSRLDEMIVARGLDAAAKPAGNY